MQAMSATCLCTKQYNAPSGVVPGMGNCCEDAAGVGLLHGQAADPATKVTGGVPASRVAEQPAEPGCLEVEGGALTISVATDS